MSNEVPVPEVELIGSIIRITQISKHEEHSVLVIPVDAVDEFCESLYWARKQHLTSLNDAARVAEIESSEFVQISDELKSKTTAQQQET